MDQILEKWDEILMTVKTEHDISDIAFNTFLRPLEFYGVTGNTAYILVPSEQLGLSYISKKYYLPPQSSNHRDHRNRIRDKVHSSGTGEVDRFFS